MCKAAGASDRVIEVQTPAVTPTLYTVGDPAVTLDFTDMWTVKNTNGDEITNNCGAVAVATASLDGFVTMGTTNLSIETNDL